jgi:hypothetical protein
VVEAGQVEETVEEEDFDLGGDGVAICRGLAGCGFEGDGEISGVLVGEGWRCGETKDVGRLVLATEVSVEAAEGVIGGEKDIDVALEACGEARSAEEGCQGSSGEGGLGRLDGDHGWACTVVAVVYGLGLGEESGRPSDDAHISESRYGAPGFVAGTKESGRSSGDADT